MARRSSKADGDRFFVHVDTHPQTLAVLATRAEPIGIELVVGDVDLLADGPYFGALFSYPTSTGSVVDWTDGDRRRARRRRAGGRGDRSARLRAAALPRRRWAPTSRSARRSGSACRWASAARTPGSSPSATGATRTLPGRLVGCQHRRRRPAGAAAGAADARAAHPAREGDVEHLHRAGAARQHRRAVRRVARARRTAADRAAHPRPGGGARRARSWQHGLRRPPRRRVRHGRGRRGRRRRRARHERSPPGSTCGACRTTAVGVAFDETSTSTTLDAVARVRDRRRRSPPPSSTASGAASRRRCCAPTRSSRSRCSTATTASTRCSATCAASPTVTSRSTAR